jgi:hypothetical protein
MSQQIATDGKIIYTPVNGRTIRMTGSVADYSRVYDEDGKTITALVNGKLKHDIGSIVRGRTKNPYKLNHITPLYNAVNLLAGYDLSVARATKSTIFLCPMLGGRRELFYWDKLLVNAFCAIPYEDNIIALLYRFCGDAEFTRFEAALEQFRNFKYKIDTDPYHVLFVFDVPEETRASYEHFVNGRYSEIDDIVKLKILDYHGFNMDGSTAKILFKSPSLKKELEEQLDVTIPEENELHSPPKLNEETFDPELYHTSKIKFDNTKFLK